MNVRDKETGKTEEVLDRTGSTTGSTSFLVTQTKLSEDGINCSQWFPDYKFDKRFEIISNK
jgi:hypothetical protein